MLRALWIVSGLLLVGSCGEDVPVGGQDDSLGGHEDDGDSTGDGDGDTPECRVIDGERVCEDSDTVDEDGDADAGQCHVVDGERVCEDSDTVDGDGSDDPLGEADGYASDSIRCTTSADCCVVLDLCRAKALVVSAADQATVRGLIDSVPQEDCLRCITPQVQVTCERDVCVGTSIEVGAEGLDEQLSQDHCGEVDTATSGTETGSNFGCSGESGSGDERAP